MEGVRVVTSLLGIVPRILRLGDICLSASPAWNDYRRRLSALCQDHEDLKSALRRYGMQKETPLLERLTAAAASLEAEEARLEGYQNIGPVLSAAFPDHLSRAIQSAEQALSDVRGLLKTREENEALLQKAVGSNAYSSHIRPGPHYVHLEIEKKLRAELEDPSARAVVLLHGGAGRGKSTLARHTAYHYGEHNRPPSTGTGAPESGEKSKFEHVFLLECGPKADVNAKLLELLQYLGPCDITTQVSVQRLLVGLLQEQTVLIILDDVREREFLEKFVKLFGTNVKCLVTSQIASLWENSSAIELEVNLLEAKYILARHGGLRNNNIPSQLENILVRIVKETDGYPLALASLASAISKKRSADIDEWMHLEKSLLNYLKRDDIVAQEYPRSFWSSMKLSLESIPDGARQLLLLASICAGPSIPEEVMRIFCQHDKMKEVAATFSKWRNDLEDRSLIAIQSEPLRWDEESSKYTWSLHALQKEFIKTEMKEKRDDLITAFLGEGKNANGENKVVNLHDKVLTILCVLYFDRDPAERAATKLNLSHHTSGLRRITMEPIIWLINKPTHEAWSETSATVARKVLCDYMSNGQMKEEDIDHLLSLPFSQKAALWGGGLHWAGWDPVWHLSRSPNRFTSASSLMVDS